MFFFARGAAELFGDFRGVRARFRLTHQILERLPFLHRVVILDCVWRVVRGQLFEHAAIALAHDVAGGKM